MTATELETGERAVRRLMASCRNWPTERGWTVDKHDAARFEDIVDVTIFRHAGLCIVRHQDGSWSQTGMSCAPEAIDFKDHVWSAWSSFADGWRELQRTDEHLYLGLVKAGLLTEAEAYAAYAWFKTRLPSSRESEIRRLKDSADGLGFDIVERKAS